MRGMVEGFQHVASVTNDLDRLASFYREIFDAQIVDLAPGDLPDGPVRHAMISLGSGVVLHAFERDGDLDRWGTEILERGRVDHFGIKVRDEAAFELLRQRLVDAGASDGEVTDFGALISAGFDDPDGTRLEICWVREDVPLDEAREPAGFRPYRRHAPAHARQ